MRAAGVRAIACAAGLLHPGLAAAFGVEAALAVRHPDHPRLSPDGAVVAAVVDTTRGDRRRRRLWLAPADAPERGALGADLDLAAGPPAWSPDGRLLAVTVRVNERPQIGLVSASEPTKVRALTKLVTGARDPVWSLDGRLIAFESRVFPGCASWGCQESRLARDQGRRARVYEQDAPRRWTRWRDGRSRHLFVIPARGGTAIDLTPEPAPAIAEPEGPDTRWAFVDASRVVYVGEAPPAPGGPRAVDTDLYMASAADPGPPVRLTESPGRDFAPTLGAADRLYYLAGSAPSGAPEPIAVRVLDLGTLKSRRLVELDLPARAVAPFGPGALLVVDRAGHRPLLFAPLGGGQPIDRVGAGTVHAVHAASSRIAVVTSRLDTPPEVEVLGPDGRRLGRSRLNGQLAPSEVSVREVHAERPNGIKVHGFLVAPKRGGPPEPRPTVVLLHGGPEGAWTDGWHPRWSARLYASARLTVLLPNLAGSVGYGRRFSDRVRESWGGAPYGDLMGFMEAAEAWPEVGSPVALAGASFGGYLVAWALAKSDRFACGVSHAGVFDPAALWGETDARWFPEWEFGGPPWAPGAVYEKWSPARYAHRIRAPMLLTHGDKDYRVPVEQSLRLFSTLTRMGLPVRFLHFPEEGHLLRDPRALETWHDATLAFLDSCLGSEPTARAE